MDTIATPSQPAQAPVHPRAGSNARQSRLVGAILLLLASGVLVTASWLHASPSGMGTHQQLGLPPCGFLQTTGWPCPSCGMTTAFAFATHGQLLDALATQPAGAVLAVATAAAALIGAWLLITGAPLAPITRLVARPALFVALALLVLLAWIYKCLTVSGIFA